MSWSWADVYPGYRVLTVIVPPELEGVFADGLNIRMVGEHVALLERLEPASKAVQTPREKSVARPLENVAVHVQTPDRAPPSPETVKALQPVVRAAAKQLKDQVPVTEQKPDDGHRLVKAARQARKHSPRTISDERPSRRPAPEPRSNAQATADLKLVEEAIASGSVTITKCPPRTFTPDDEIGYRNPLKRFHQERRTKKPAMKD